MLDEEYQNAQEELTQIQKKLKLLFVRWQEKKEDLKLLQDEFDMERCVSTRVSMRAHACEHVRTRTYAYGHKHVHARTHARVHMRVEAHTDAAVTRSLTRAHMYVCIR